MTHRFTTARTYGLMRHEGKILLVRSSNPQFDPPLWWLPGGGINFGETPENALIREFLEETGLLIHNPQLFDVASDIRERSNGDLVHTVRIIYKVTWPGGELVHENGGTTQEARWFTHAELHELHMAHFAKDALLRSGYLEKKSAG
jgi:8-oxo-dGTP diphosphatase